jgi:hypothetical protein
MKDLICGAFLHINLISPVMIVTCISKGIDHPHIGKMCIVCKLCYGLGQSNKAFADDFDATVKAAGFFSVTDACVYKRMKAVLGAPNKP